MGGSKVDEVLKLHFNFLVSSSFLRMALQSNDEKALELAITVSESMNLMNVIDEIDQEMKSEKSENLQIPQRASSVHRKPTELPQFETTREDQDNLNDVSKGRRGCLMVGRRSYDREVAVSIPG